MTDIFPAEGRSVGEVITELAELGLVQDQDFRLHWTWDMRPFVRAEPAAYKKWQSKHGGDEDTAAETSEDTEDDKSTSDSEHDKGSSTSRKRGGK